MLHPPHQRLMAATAACWPLKANRMKSSAFYIFWKNTSTSEENYAKLPPRVRRIFSLSIRTLPHFLAEQILMMFPPHIIFDSILNFTAGVLRSAHSLQRRRCRHQTTLGFQADPFPNAPRDQIRCKEPLLRPLLQNTHTHKNVYESETDMMNKFLKNIPL